MSAKIHPTAIVDPRAEIAGGVTIGPYAIIEAGVRVSPDTEIGAHVVLRGPTGIGASCVIHPFAVVGGAPQAKRHHGGPSPLEMGEHNVVREHVTIHGGTEGRTTRIGHHNLLMVGSHVAHDCAVGSHVVLANAVQLAGHAVVEDGATFGGLAGVAQFVRVGELAFVAAGAMCERDVPPFVIVQGDRARVRGVNRVGLRRRGVPEESIRALARAVRALWGKGATRAVERGDPYVERLLGDPSLGSG
jgi:UDP-N-acetylglucosamine acyltransferase